MFAAFSAGGGKGILLSGRPGVGKSRLANEFLQLLADKGFKPISASARTDAASRLLHELMDLLPDYRRGSQTVGEGLRLPASPFPSEEPPIAVLIDDVDQLGESDISILHDLLSADGVFVLGTLADSDHATTTGWRFWKHEALGILEVDPLDERAVAQLLAAVLGGPVELRTRCLLPWLAGGDLSALRELVICAITSGALRRDGGVWQLTDDIRPSRSLISLIEARLSRLSSDERHFLEVVAQANPLRPEDVVRFGSTGCAEALERRGLLALGQVPHRGRGLVLPSPIAAEVVRSRTPALARQRVARELADLEEAKDRAEIDLLKLAQWRMASDEGSAELMLEGARAAHQSGDLVLATALTRRSSDLGSTSDSAMLDAKLQVLAGRPEEGLAAIRSLLGQELDDDELRTLAGAALEVPTFGICQESWALREAALPKMPDTAPLAELSSAGYGGWPDRSTPRLRALPAEPDRPDVPDDAWNLMLTAYRRMRGGRGATAQRLAQRGERAHRTAARTPEWRPWIFSFLQVESLIELGQLQSAYRAGKQHLIDHLPDTDMEPLAWFSWQLCRLCADCGFPNSAVDHGLTAVALFRRLSRPDLEQLATASLALALAVDGNSTDAGARLEAVGEPLSPDLGWTSDIARARAWVAVARGDVVAARQWLCEAVAEARTREDVAGESMLLHTLARIGDAGSVVDRLGTLAERVEGDLAAARAEHARGLADHDPEALERCSHTFERLGAWMVAAETATAAAEMWRRRMDRDRAASASTRGMSLTARCGDPTPLSTKLVAPVDSLTRAERVVAELATTGLANKEIASKLSVSQRTVENQLHQVYRKLGIASRHQLATALRFSRSVPAPESRPA